MDDEKGWLRAHARTAVILVLIFGLALFLRVYFVYGLAFTGYPPDCTNIFTPGYTGGSDSYYWDRALCYSFQTGRDLGTDVQLNYPLTMNNPRPPLFPWFSLLVGSLLAPLFGNEWHAVYFTFLLSTGLFGALTVFPTYALGKEAFGRRAGFVGALLLAISVGHLQRSVAADADHDALTLFFVVCVFYFFLRALRTMNRRRWVENWFRRDSITSGVRGFARENRKSILYAIFSGLCLSVIALSWQGWAYVAVILLAWFGVELFLDRFRNEDTMGTWILFCVALATPLVIAFQWYFIRSQTRVWFDVPAFLFLAAVVLGLVFTVTRDYPWTLVVPSTLIAAAIGLFVGGLVNPTLTNAFFTGAGYFIQTKVVTTIAEAQAPGMSQMILSFGLFTFGLSGAATVYMLWQIPRRRDPAYTIAVVWVFAAIFMAITAARFIFNASPAFAISAGFAIDQLLVRSDFAGMRRTYRSLAAGSWRNAIRKSLKLRHILAALAIVFLVLLPNVWWAVDASIPFEHKTRYDRQVAALLPPFLQAPGYDPTGGAPFYFGAFGYNVPRATDYYPAAWRWFATQDADRPAELRPAFLSWWDYGFEAVDRGVHPTVADNFQNGYALAGQFITAQNESQGISLLAIRLLEGEVRHRGDLRPAVVMLLEGLGLPVDPIRAALRRPQDVIPVVLGDAATYGAWDPNMHQSNALYIYLTHIVAGRLSMEGVVSLYHGLRQATGWDIGYFAVDSRLFPLNAQNTGIFYAPVKLSDHRVINLPDGRVLPAEFFQLLASTARGDIPVQDLQPDDQVQGQSIRYLPPFYNSMFYRAYVGYSPADLGNLNSSGIPGLDTALQGTPPTPAWNLSHWRVVYRTSYYNPFADAANHTDAWRAMNFPDAERIQDDIRENRAEGIVDLSPVTTLVNGVVFLRYYDGAWVNGTVSAGSTPLPDVRITVADELGTPHFVTTTDANGRYSALVPFGTVTITASILSPQRTTLIGARTLASFTLPVTIDQAMRVPADSNGDTIPDWIMTRDIQVPARAATGRVFYDINRDSVFNPGDIAVRDASLTITHREFGYSRTIASAADGTYSIEGLPNGPYRVAVDADGRTLQAGNLTIAGSDLSQGLPVPFAAVRGTVRSTLGSDVASTEVVFRDETNSTVLSVRTDAAGQYVLRPLLPGNFTVTASRGDLAALPAKIRVEASDLVLNFTLAPSGTVTGRTFVFGTPRPFAGLDFQSATDPRIVRSTTSDGDARYSIRLSAGEWYVGGRLYDPSGLYATLGRVTVASGHVAAHNAIFLPGARVSGTVSDPNPSVRDPRADVAFSSPAGQLWLRTDFTGQYLAFLPSGTYDLQAFNAAGAHFASTSVAGVTSLDLPLLETSEAVDWTIYRDLNRNGVMDAGEGIPGSHISLTDDRGARIALTTNVGGTAAIRLFGNRTYSGAVTAAGFEARSINASTPTALRAMNPIALAPAVVQVQGSVLLGGSPLVAHPITVRAIPAGAGAVAATTRSDSNGGYGFGLVPGTYLLVIDENVSTSHDRRYQNRGTDRVELAVGQMSLARDLDIVARDLVRGNVTLNGTARAATVSFEGPERRSVNATTTGFEIYLMAGTYSVTGNHTSGSDEYRFIATATVPPASNLSFALVKATRVSGHAVFNNLPVRASMPITFVRREGGTLNATTNVDGAFVTFLVAGNYTVRLGAAVNETEAGGVVRFYRYTFEGMTTVAPNQGSLAFDLVLSRTLDNTTAAGLVTRSGVGVDANLAFLARGAGAISMTTSSTTDGRYSVSLAPGTYDVYATRSIGSGAFLARIAVPHAATFAQDIPLESAFHVSGVSTNPQGGPTSASITIASGAELALTSNAAGTYDAFLPAGSYTITATKPATENGMAVTYRATTSFTLASDGVVNLPLAKIVSRSASLAWDASEGRLIPAGGSVTYTIVVRNTGNIADTFNLEGRPVDWQFSFAPASASLDFGSAGGTSLIRVVIQSPANAVVDHSPIQIVATSAADGTTVGSVEVRVDIVRVRAVSLSLDSTSAHFDIRNLAYVMSVRNSGNARETLTVTIANPDDLAALGWSAQIGPLTGSLVSPTLRNVTVEANATTTLRLEAQPHGGSGEATIVLRVAAEDAQAVSATGVFKLQLPVLAPGGVGVSGPLVTRSAPPDTQIIAIVAGAVSAVGLGLVLSRRRR